MIDGFHHLSASHLARPVSPGTASACGSFFQGGSIVRGKSQDQNLFIIMVDMTPVRQKEKKEHGPFSWGLTFGFRMGD